MECYILLINEQWQETGGENVRNEFTHSEVVAQLSLASREHVARAVQVARRAADRWSYSGL